MWVLVGLAIGYALGRLQPASATVGEPSKEKNAKLVAAGRKAIKDRGWHDRWRCDECGFETNLGNVAKHQQQTGHSGRTRVG